MTLTLQRRGIAAVLLDIEGTTTPLAFVHETLFPFARARMPAFLRECWASSDVRRAVAQLASEHREDVAAGSTPPDWTGTRDAAERYALWLMDRDRKSPGLKALQGWIWEQGYRAGDLKSEIFADVAPAIRRWRSAGIAVAIYSSGSELAQRLLFGNTPDGDLTPLLTAFFDTSVGPKIAADSYHRITAALALEPARVLFVSDVTRELRAAQAAGLPVLLARRPGNPPQTDAADLETITSFAEDPLG